MRLHEVPIPVSIDKFCWHKAAPIHLHIVYSRFCATAAQVRHSDGDDAWPAEPTLFTNRSFVDRLSTPDVNQRLINL